MSYTAKPDILTTDQTDLILTLDEEVQQLLSVNDSLSEVGHETYESSVPLVDYLGEGGGARRHEDLSHSVVVPRKTLLVHSQETLRRPLLGHLATDGTR